MKPRFLYTSLGGIVFASWAAVLGVVMGARPIWIFVDGALAGFFVGGLVYAEVYRRAARYERERFQQFMVIQAERLVAAEVKRITDELDAAADAPPSSG